MIHIIGDYHMQIEGDSIVVGLICDVKHKDGTTSKSLRKPHYFMSVDEALRDTYKRVSIGALQDIDGELKDAVIALYALRNDFYKAIKELTAMLDAMRDDGK